MKAHHLIAPSLALAASAYWLLSQNNSIRKISEKTKTIRERVLIADQAITETPFSFASSNQKEAKDEFTLPDGSINWEAIAETMANMQNPNGMPSDIKRMLKLQSLMMELTSDELIEGLEKITTFNLKPEALAMLKHGLLDQLAEKDSLAALETLGDLNASLNDTLYWSYIDIIGKVAKEHPAKAIAWLDQKIAEGTIQSTALNAYQDSRLRFEGALINALISSDITAAKKRLESFDHNQRSHILLNGNGFHPFKKSEAGKHLELIREMLPPEKASETITQAFSSQYHNSLDKISQSIEGLSFTEKERTQIITQMVTNYARNTNDDTRFQKIYEWSQTESPGQEAALVSSALNNNQNLWNNPQASFQKALTVSENLNDPEIITQFVSNLSQQGNPNFIKDQLTKFKDPDLAEKYRTLVEALPQNSSPSE